MSYDDSLDAAPVVSPPLRIAGDWLHINSTSRVRLSSVMMYRLNDPHDSIELLVDGVKDCASVYFYANGDSLDQTKETAKAALLQLDQYFSTGSNP